MKITYIFGPTFLETFCRVELKHFTANSASMLLIIGIILKQKVQYIEVNPSLIELKSEKIKRYTLFKKKYILLAFH